MGCCFSTEEDDQGSHERSPLLPDSRTSAGHPAPTSSLPTNHLSKTDEESALNQILQRTANDVIDVTYVEPHSLERSELMGRTREYQAQIASLRRVKSSSAMPNSDQPPPIALSRELTSSADLKFLLDRSEATDAAVASMEVKHGEALVVQFAAP
ncbi:PREDICTED: ragulator complex protein LAMTOR1-like [Amphimedon queenslandica]|uniref:Ragulator complex protein LAMTOR1 n=1 Tax=Amphimedon queenslandica TaxID=400682 RepID=A0A1X7VLP7_AMPQE|nr:PREDICTED: ragulator complex protein LAMTOR1-like [Amphimedon queenslandica]|eukprot:XP_003383573.1 PREDICTED: ragulator complex protein LAMTOR1-like [Amphimedon queenslandica]